MPTPSKRDLRPENRVPFLLRSAFTSATQGDEKSAWNRWRAAIRAGFIVTDETEAQLRLAINRGRRDLGLPPHPLPAKPGGAADEREANVEDGRG